MTASIWAASLGPGLSIIAAIAIIVVGSVLGLKLGAVLAMLVFILAGTFVAALLTIPFSVGSRRTSLDRVRTLDNFARDHGLTYESEQRPPDLIVSAFGFRPRAVVYDSLNSLSPQELSMGTYVRPAKPDGSGFTEDWGYLAMRLKRKLPNILLESRSSRSLFADAGLLGNLNTTQRLSLEGDFDKHFRLFCPAGYEQDALYVFTPDLMALLIDEAGDVSAQLIGDVIVFFSAKPFDLSHTDLRDRLLRIADVVGAKALSQTARYSDPRSEEGDTVAKQGQKLSRSTPRWLILLMFCSAQVLLGLGITWLLLVICLGLDPTQWTASSYSRW